jgi:DNA-directed RNA polymerase specialized sigma24 family protein
MHGEAGCESWKDALAEAADLRERLIRHRRRLCLLLRALLPAAADAATAWNQTANRIAERGHLIAPKDFAEWAERIARDIAAERRKTQSPPPFSDDLFRQLADSAEASLAIAEERPRALAEILARLPSPEKELLRKKYGVGLSVEQIAMSEGRPPAAVARDLTILHGTLVSALHDALKKDGPPLPGGASDLGRLADRLLDGTITDDGRVVLETLLLADAPAQAHYHRHVALLVELEFKYRGEPELPAMPQPELPVASTREWLVTAAFIVACTAVALFVILAFTGRLKSLW